MHIPRVKQPIKIQRNFELGISHIQMQPTIHASHQSQRMLYFYIDRAYSFEHVGG